MSKRLKLSVSIYGQIIFSMFWNFIKNSKKQIFEKLCFSKMSQIWTKFILLYLAFLNLFMEKLELVANLMKNIYMLRKNYKPFFDNIFIPKIKILNSGLNLKKENYEAFRQFYQTNCVHFDKITKPAQNAFLTVNFSKKGTFLFWIFVTSLKIS